MEVVSELKQDLEKLAKEDHVIIPCRDGGRFRGQAEAAITRHILES